MKRLFVWAHRGASAVAPENTLAAFAAAEAAGAHGLELDVQLSSDGVPVVIHDRTLNRTSNGHGSVSRRTLAQLKQLDAGSWFGSGFAGETIPTLEEVFAWRASRLRINVEIKNAAAGKAVLDLARRFSKVSVVVSSFDYNLLRELRSRAPELPLGFLWERGDWTVALESALACRAESFNPRHTALSAAMVCACHQQGLAIHPWTVDGASALQNCLQLGVDGLFCNDPAQVLTWLAGP